MLIITGIISFLAIGRFARLIRYALADPMARGLVVAVAVVLAIGTGSYSLMEGWGLLDSAYFCVVTLLTIGYGDFAPETAAGKIFTIIYTFTGVGLFALAATTIVQRGPGWARLEERDRLSRVDSGYSAERE